MSDLERRATTLAGQTLDRLAFRLSKIVKKWGPEDYPNDNGVDFRNRLFLFADWMLYLFKQGCSERPDVPNKWINSNATKFLALSGEEFMRCIGACRVHMQAFGWHMHFANSHTACYDDAGVRSKLQVFGRQLDWIYTVHDLPVDVATRWHHLVVAHIDHAEGYIEATKSELGKYLVTTSLGWSEASSPEMWDPWACAAEMSSWNQIDQAPKEAQQLCERVFANF